MKKLFASGKMNPVIDGHDTLSQTREAMWHFESGNHKGKVVISLEEIKNDKPCR